MADILLSAGAARGATTKIQIKNSFNRVASGLSTRLLLKPLKSIYDRKSKKKFLLHLDGVIVHSHGHSRRDLCPRQWLGRYHRGDLDGNFIF